MSLASGTRVGVYEVVSLLGAGGMGEVYRARDVKLNRDVALKILPEAFTVEGDRVARFRREAQVLAALNHPNIAHIHGFEDSGSTHALVLELVEGPTLADRIANGPLPLDEALPIAKQIAEALEAAHEQGIIHRDLKPANIKVRDDGAVKVLDFGLAKAMESPASAVSVTMSPTISLHATQAGIILGTAAYMAPEQARGKPVDKRADIWAFGVVLFELLAGHRPIGPSRAKSTHDEDITEVLAALARDEPAWEKLPDGTPLEIRRLLRRCLQKDPRQRLRDVGDARLALEDLGTAPATREPTTVFAARERFVWMSALVVTALGLGAVAVYSRRPVVAAPEMRVEIVTPATTETASIAVSPDGQKIAFVAAGEGPSRLWVRSIETTTAQALAGTEGATLPFWSPDGRSLGFFADQQLKRVDIAGGPPMSLASAPAGWGGTWSRDGAIVFAETGIGALVRIAAGGGDIVPATRIDRPRQTAHVAPRFLPDGRHFLFRVTGKAEARGIYVGSLDGSRSRRLIDSDSGAEFVPPSHLLFLRQGILVAQRFDADTQALSGDPFPVAQGVEAVSASNTGEFIYRTRGRGIEHQLVWFDRTGRTLGPAILSDASDISNPELSPDGRTLAIDRRVDDNQDVWLLELSRGVLSRFTSDPALDRFPLWSSNGSRIFFSSTRNGGVFRVYQKPADGNGAEEALSEAGENNASTAVSMDGRYLAYRENLRKLHVMPLQPNEKPLELGADGAYTRNGQFSPDDRWVTYESNESGKFEVYVQAFPGLGGKVQVSTAGGAQPRWRGDGKELFYIARTGQLMAVPVRLPTAASAQRAELDAPTTLFQTRVAGGPISSVDRAQYVVSRDGQRFLINSLPDIASPPITMVLNWKPKE